MYVSNILVLLSQISDSTRKGLQAFGLSHELAISAIDSSSHPKVFPLSSPIVLDKGDDNIEGKGMSDKDPPTTGLRRTRSWRSVGTKPADRLTVFRATFGSNSGRRGVLFGIG